MSPAADPDDPSPAAVREALARLLTGRTPDSAIPSRFDVGSVSSDDGDDSGLAQSDADASNDSADRGDRHDGGVDDAVAASTSGLIRQLATVDSVETLAGLFDDVGEPQLRRAVDEVGEGVADGVADDVAEARETLDAVDDIRAVAADERPGRDTPDEGDRATAADHFRSGHTTGINAAGEPRDE